MDSDRTVEWVQRWGSPPAGRPIVIAGPCSAESHGQVMKTAAALNAVGVKIFRAGLWKARTLPGRFEGVGPQGLAWLGEVKETLGMKVCTEVAGSAHVEACLKAGIDLLWIGARTTANPFLVQEISDALKGTDIPVLVKNPVSPDIGLWAGALERLGSSVGSLGVIHRGFITDAVSGYRNVPCWHLALEFRSRFPQIPFFCDPSHLGGDARFVAGLSQHALDLGMDGLMIESHCCPGKALSDAKQQITPGRLGKILAGLSVRCSDTQDSVYRSALTRLRESIDRVDGEIIDLLAERMDICREIGRLKKENNISIVQKNRWDEVIRSVCKSADEHGMDRKFVVSIFNSIHDASVTEQNKILSEK